MPRASTVDVPAAEPEAPRERWGARRRLVAVVAAGALTVAALAAVEIARPEPRTGPPPGGWTLVPHTGLGAWVDVYDWTLELGGPTPSVDLDDMDAMAEAGVQTVYLQSGHDRSSADVIEPARLRALIERAHEQGLHVVAWYLPTFVDVDRDLERLAAAAELPVDGLGVDIEATDVTDPVERSRRVVDLSTRLRTILGDDKAMAAITLSSVHVQVVNPSFWPGYPWAELGATYDVILPMAYWSIRQGELRDAERYVSENLERIKASAGQEVPVHPVGGIADEATVTDLEGMVAAIQEGGAIGGGLYDWNTSTPEQWAALQPLRELRDDPGSG